MSKPLTASSSLDLEGGGVFGATEVQGHSGPEAEKLQTSTSQGSSSLFRTHTHVPPPDFPAPSDVKDSGALGLRVYVWGPIV